MRRTITNFLIVFSLSLGNSTCVAAQSPSADRFLAAVAAHPVGDQVEQDQAEEISLFLKSTSRPEAEKVLPAILATVRSGNDLHVRQYATGFLLMVAMRPDGASLLSSSSKEISSLIVDANSGVQRGALAVMDYLIGKAGTNNQPYLSALQTALRNPQTRQDAGEQMIQPLLSFGSGDPDSLTSVLSFLRRDDLTFETRSELVHHLSVVPGLPEEVNQYLVKRLDDPDPRVRAVAVVAYADSLEVAAVVAETALDGPKTNYAILAKSRVERMANDPQENAQVRELAKEAMAGKTGLNPSIDLPPDNSNKH